MSDAVQVKWIDVPEGEAKVVALDSTKPDLDEGEIGHEHYAWIDSEFRNWGGLWPL